MNRLIPNGVDFYSHALHIPNKPNDLGPRAGYGEVVDGSTLQVTFSACVNITGTTGIEYSVEGGPWTEVAGVVKISDTVYQFDTTPTTIGAGEEVRWRYVGGSGTIVDCEEAEDIGDQGPINLAPIPMAGTFVLVEGGGFVLTEEGNNVETEGSP